jgi:DNA-binding MarR family transcriptional regulator
MYRLLGDNHALEGLPFSVQVFLRALDGILNRLANASGISGLEIRSLSHVAEQPGLTVDAMGEFLELAPGATSTVVMSLLSQELISMAGDPAAPGFTFALTPRGHEVITTMSIEFQRAIMAAASTLDDERRTGLESGMLKMARKLEQQVAIN